MEGIPERALSAEALVVAPSVQVLIDLSVANDVQDELGRLFLLSFSSKFHRSRRFTTKMGSTGASKGLPTRVIAGIDVVDTPLVRAAQDFARAHSDDMTYRERNSSR